MPRKCKSPREKALFKAKEELDLITADVSSKQQDLDAATIAFNQAVFAYDSQKDNINAIKSQLSVSKEQLSNSGRDTTPLQGAAAVGIAGHWNPRVEFQGECTWRYSPHNNIDQVCKTKQNQLSTKVQEQEGSLTQAENDLNNKNSDKNNKEQLKIQANTALQNTIALKNQAEISFTVAQKEFQQEIDLLFSDSGEEDITMHDHSGDKVDPTQETIIENTPETAKCAGDHIDKYEDYPIYHMNN